MFNTKQTTLIQHLVATTVNQENAETRTRMLLQGLGNMEEQARNARVIFARAPHGWVFSSPQRKQTVKRSYQAAFAIVNPGHLLTNKCETKARSANTTMAKGKEVSTEDTVPLTQLQASQAETSKQSNKVESLEQANRTLVSAHKQEVNSILSQVEADKEALIQQVKELREENQKLNEGLNRLTHENHTTIKAYSSLKEAVLSTTTRKELKKMAV